MPAIPNGAANVTFVIQRTGDTRPYTSSFGVTLTNPAWSNTNADTYAQALKTATLPNLSSGDTLTVIDFAYNVGPGVLHYQSPVNTVGSGASATQCVSQNSAVLLQKHTARPGRKGRGRMYWPYLIEAEVDNVGVLSSIVLTRNQTMIAAWISATTAAVDFETPVLLHEDPVDVPNAITSWTVSPVIATQRRRIHR